MILASLRLSSNACVVACCCSEGVIDVFKSATVADRLPRASAVVLPALGVTFNDVVLPAGVIFNDVVELV